MTGTVSRNLRRKSTMSVCNVTGEFVEEKPQRHTGVCFGGRSEGLEKVEEGLWLLFGVAFGALVR